MQIELWQWHRMNIYLEPMNPKTIIYFQDRNGGWYNVTFQGGKFLVSANPVDPRDMQEFMDTWAKQAHITFEIPKDVERYVIGLWFPVWRKLLQSVIHILAIDDPQNLCYDMRSLMNKEN